MAQRRKQDGIWYEYPRQEIIRLGYRVYLLVNAKETGLRRLARFADTLQWRSQGWLIKKIDLIDLEASRRDLDIEFRPPRDPRWNFTALIAIKARDKNTMRRVLPVVLRTLGLPDETAIVVKDQPYSPNW